MVFEEDLKGRTEKAGGGRKFFNVRKVGRWRWFFCVYDSRSIIVFMDIEG